MKKLNLILSLILIIGGILVGCSAVVSPDYTTTEFENALNNGEMVEGKIVSVDVSHLEPDSAFGYNIQAGEHLNFVSAENPGVKEGDIIVVKVEKVASMFGSYIITYEK